MAKWGRWFDGKRVEVREMRDAETTLAIINDRGKRGLRLDRIYRQLFNKDLWIKAYARIAKNAGAMTKGTTDETVDGMSVARIEGIIELLRNERYRWTPVRRVMIPKGNGKTRPLGIPTFSDRLLQEVMRSILEAYYEPQFSPTSHGFRPERGCHTALKDIFHAWTGTKWFIEGDIKGCFDNIDHTIMIETLRERIDDGRFLSLVAGLLKAGYLEEWQYRPTLSGTPQGGVISPLLANIYLDKLDKFVEQVLIPEFTKGRVRKRTKHASQVHEKLKWLRKRKADGATLKPLLKEQKRMVKTDPMDPAYRRLRYIRYADDFLLGFAGPKDEAEEIKRRIGEFLRDHLKLEMSPEKTKITHGRDEKARFLGYDITVRNVPAMSGIITLLVPAQKIEEQVAKYMRDGKAIHRPELRSNSDYTIISLYGSEYRGFVQYYAFAKNRFWLDRLRRGMEVSMLKTLAAKHRSTVSKMARKHQSIAFDRDRFHRCFIATVNRPGKDPLVARFGGLSLKMQPSLKVVDGPTGVDRYPNIRSELITRLMTAKCELCGSTDRIQVHHLRKLADLKRPGQRGIPLWKQVMISRQRKTLVVCHRCHTDIHAGRPTRIRVTPEVN